MTSIANVKIIKFGIYQSLFLIVIPLGLLLVFIANDIVLVAHEQFGLSINKGDVVIFYLVVSALASKYGHKLDRERKEDNPRQ